MLWTQILFGGLYITLRFFHPKFLILVSMSLRIEGRGNALIQGVSASKIPLSWFPETSSALLEELKNKKAIASSALERYKKATSAIGKYMDTLTVEHLDISKLGQAMDVYDATEGKWEEKTRAVEAELAKLELEMIEEERKLEFGEEKGKRKLRTKVEIGLFRADEDEGDVEIVLVYGAFPVLDLRLLSQ